MIDILKDLLKTQFYVVVRTKYTIHHIEKLLASCRDRGRWKWIAESIQPDQYEAQRLDDEARRSHVDATDCFPRFFFNDFALMSELSSWIQIRGLEVIEVSAPKI